MAVVQFSTDRIVCRCLQITEQEIEGAIADGTFESVKCVIDRTGAGSGCTACHGAIKAMLAEHCQPPSSPPT